MIPDDDSRASRILLTLTMVAATTTPSVALATEYTIDLAADGTFYAPSTSSNYVEILEGDTVTFTGLERTDGIVQTNPLTIGTVDPCREQLPRPYINWGGAPAANEFTGPMRAGVSGIFSLGPMAKPGETESFQEYDLGTTAPPAGYNACTIGTPKAQVLDPSDGHYYQLCRDNPVSNDTMQVTFDNPDIDGIIIRMNWSDIETGHDAYGDGIFDWTQLDDQMTRAVENGKVFTVDFRAGIWGVPDHEYTDYPGTPGAVTPLYFQTVLGTSVTPPACGSWRKLPSPGDPYFKDAYEDFLSNMIEHIQSNTAWWQGLAHIKLSGVNLNTSEAKTAHLCDPGCPATACATRLWSEAELVAPGLGWTPERLYTYYREVGNTIYTESLMQKSIGYQLIQAGFPRALAPTNPGDVVNYYVEGPTDDGNAADDYLLPGGTTQTSNVLDYGQDGDFADRTMPSVDLMAGMAFVPQHSGLQTNPEDPYNKPLGAPAYTCAYHQPIVTDPASPWYGMAQFPFTGAWNWSGLDAAGTGCPNRWARREGYEWQLTGWQTNNANGVANANEVSSALFNATTNSNGVFVELYEERLWEIMHLRGTGPTAAPVTDDVGAAYYAHRKNLDAWSQELHQRRKHAADLDPTGNPFVADPFPTQHSHTFTEPLDAGEERIYRFISPYKCIHGGSGSMQRVGLIRVTGV